MALQSQLFQGDPKLEAAAVSDPAHIVPGAKGEHVRKIQLALNQLDGAGITADGSYGPGTAAAVLAYKQKRNIINRSIQTKADNIVGKLTIASMDAELGKSVKPVKPSNPLLLNLKISELLVDVFIKMEGFGSPGKQGRHDPVQSANFSLSIMSNPRYNTKERFLTSFIFSGSLDSRNPSQTVISAVQEIDKRGVGQVDRIFMWGGSAGGKNVLTIANALAGSLGDKIEYIALSDAAFDENDPVLKNPGNIKAKVKKNWFQTYGQTIDPRKEFHGGLPGFVPFDMTGSPEVQAVKKDFESRSRLDQLKGQNRAAAADSAHNIAFAEGLRVGVSDIRGLLLKPTP